MAEVNQIDPNIHVVYRHLRNNGKVFYVGKGKGKRPYVKSNRNPYWKNIAENGYTVEIVAEKS